MVLPIPESKPAQTSLAHFEVREIPPSVEGFLALIESKTKEAAHLRLLKAARSADPLAAMNAALVALAGEIIDET